MMEQLTIDTGLRSYAVNGGPEQGGGILRFNPGDPNVYGRFLEARQKFLALEEQLSAQPPCDGQQAIGLLTDTDRKVKELLSWVFGSWNDFDAMLGGTNLMAVAGNGERVITNLFAALQPILEEGAQACADRKAREAVQQAQAERAARAAQ